MTRVSKSERNSLRDIELTVAREFEKKRRKRMSRAEARAHGITDTMRVSKPVREGRRKPPAVPPGKSLKEIHEMDPDDPSFKIDRNKQRKHEKYTTLDSDWKELAKKDHQDRRNAARAKIRKYETEIVKAVEVLEEPVRPKERREMEVYDEDKVIAEGILSLDDWDDEELIRGYRRSRNGRWGPAPKYIPREVQLEVFRRLVQRGDRKMREAYLKSISNLVDLSEDASSEKVRLDAIKELMNRVVGKVPDRVHIGVEQPYESILADALVPLSESAVLDLDTDDDGVAFLAPYAGDESAGEVETDTARDAASRGPATVNGTPSPARTSKSKKKPNK